MKIKKIMVCMCMSLILMSINVPAVYAQETVSDEEVIVETTDEIAPDDDPVAIDTSGANTIKIEDKGSFHPDTRDAIEMIVSFIILFVVLNLIFNFSDKLSKSKSKGKEDDGKEKEEGLSLVRIGGYVAVILVMFLFFRFIIASAQIPSASMEPTLKVKDRCLINRLSYIGTNPERGDIVIFKNKEEFGNEILIKRVIGLPGDHIAFYGGNVYINGNMVEEEYLSADVFTYSETSFFDVPEGCYFLMGDNRGNSADSRYWKNPYLSEDKIMGKHIITIHLGK